MRVSVLLSLVSLLLAGAFAHAGLEGDSLKMEPLVDKRPKELRMTIEEVYQFKALILEYITDPTYTGHTEAGQFCQVKLMEPKSKSNPGLFVVMEVSNSKDATAFDQLFVGFSLEMAVKPILLEQSESRLSFETVMALEDEYGEYQQALQYLSIAFNQKGRPTSIYIYDQTAMGQGYANINCILSK